MLEPRIHASHTNPVQCSQVSEKACYAADLQALDHVLDRRPRPLPLKLRIGYNCAVLLRPDDPRMWSISARGFSFFFALRRNPFFNFFSLFPLSTCELGWLSLCLSKSRNDETSGKDVKLIRNERSLHRILFAGLRIEIQRT